MICFLNYKEYIENSNWVQTARSGEMHREAVPMQQREFPPGRIFKKSNIAAADTFNQRLEPRTGEMHPAELSL